MRLASCVIAAAAILSPSLASAEVPAAPASTDERRLTPEQVEAVLAEAASKRHAAEAQVPAAEPVIDDADLPPIRDVHGEVGVSIGSGGYREMFGTSIYPLGDDGMAAISLDFVDWGHRHDRR
jgi:hypothetical protein